MTGSAKDLALEVVTALKAFVFAPSTSQRLDARAKLRALADHPDLSPVARAMAVGHWEDMANAAIPLGIVVNRVSHWETWARQ